MQQEVIRIPKERVAILIGHDGKTRKVIENSTKSKLAIDSKTGEVEVNFNSIDNFKFRKILMIVKAIGRGFAPEKALLLLNDEFTLQIVNIEEYAGKSTKAVNAKKGRIIGEKGTTREKIERETNCRLSVYGKTIAIIGNVNEIPIALKTIEMLLEGAMHKTAYAYLENRGTEFEL